MMNSLGFRYETCSNKETRHINVALPVSIHYPVPGVYKYGNLVLQVGGVSNLRQ
jgi:hypothetical protein